MNNIPISTDNPSLIDHILHWPDLSTVSPIFLSKMPDESVNDHPSRPFNHYGQNW